MINFRNHHAHLKYCCATLVMAMLLPGCGGGGGDTGGNPDNFDPNAVNNKPVPVSSSSGSSVTAANSSINASKSSSSIASSASSSSKTSTSTSSGPDAAPPQAPQVFVATAESTNMVTIQWTASDDNIGVVRYRIYRDQVQIDTADGFDSSYTDFNVSLGKTYTYGISAGDAAGNWSQLKVTTAQTTMKSSSSSSAAQKPTSSSSTKTSSFTSMSLSSISTSSNSSISSSSTTGTTPSSSSSLSSASSSIVDTTAPSAPDTINNDAATSSRVDISWSAAEDDVSVTQYKVYRDSVMLSVLTSNILSFSDNSATASQQYTYEVAAGDAAGNWSATKSIVITTPAIASTTNLIWSHPSNRENMTTLELDKIAGYEIRFKRPSQRDYTYVTVMGNRTTTFSVTGLPSDANFEIACFDADGAYSEFAAIALH